jgi:ribosomal protein S12 methylthiotransferase
MKVHFVSLGCARNQVDTETMSGSLLAAGHTLTPEAEQAEVVVVNTCSFIESAVDESIDTILALSQLKETGACRKLVVAGCLPERYQEDIAASLPEVDLFLGTGAFDQIVKAVEAVRPQEKCLLPDPDAIVRSGTETKRILSQAHTAYLKIAEGCDRHCTYCIIPRLRGRQKSRPMPHIVQEARGLIDAGVKEIVLVAQDTTAYGIDLGLKHGLANLLTNLAEISPTIWLRVLYGHPESIDSETIAVMGGTPNICAYFDIPVQHASDPVLKRMGRHYSGKDLYRLFHDIRKRVPDASLRTTLIVGFPGETEADFETLLSFVADIRFDHLGVFTYSDADDLPSHGLAGHVSHAMAGERYDAVMSRQLAISEANNQRFVDATLPVLIEEASGENLYTGRTVFQAPEVDGLTFVHGENLQPGAVVNVKIIDAYEYDLVGETSD